MSKTQRPPGSPVPSALPTRTSPLTRCLQRDNRGCVLACIAILAGRRYDEIAALAETQGWLDEIRRRGTHRDKRQALLALVRVRTGHGVCCGQWTQVRQLALVTLRYPDCGTQHSVVYDPVAGGVLDPNPAIREDVRRDFSNMPIIRYLPILRLPSARERARRSHEAAGYGVVLGIAATSVSAKPRSAPETRRQRLGVPD